VEMVGSEEASILIAWTMVCRSFLRVGSMKPRLPACLDAKMWVVARVGR
jgi:hypothetical protein